MFSNRDPHLKVFGCQLSVRGFGIFVFLGSCAALWFLLIHPLALAARHESFVIHTRNGLIFLPLTLVMSGLFTVFGEKLTRIFGTPARPTPRGGLLMMSLIVVGVLLNMWFCWQLRACGYNAPGI